MGRGLLTKVVKGFFGWIAAILCVALVILVVGNRGQDMSELGSILDAIKPAVIVVISTAFPLALILPVVRSVSRQRKEQIPGAYPSGNNSSRKPIDDKLTAILKIAGYSGDPRKQIARDDRRQTRISKKSLDKWGSDAIVNMIAYRSLQASNFVYSTDFDKLPLWGKDAIRLIDLRREISLKGLQPYLLTPSGYYLHDIAGCIETAQRNGLDKLAQTLTFADHAVRINDPREVSDCQSTLRVLLNDNDTWLQLREHQATAHD